MDAEQRRILVDRYREGYDVILEALEGANELEMDAREGPTEWSPREIVHHLADSEMTSAIRLRKLLTEEQTEITGYDQDEFARRLHYDRPIEHSLSAFQAARLTTAEILERLSEDDWGRQGRHSEHGSYSVIDWLKIYAAHAHEHADQIRRARHAAAV